MVAADGAVVAGLEVGDVGDAGVGEASAALRETGEVREVGERFSSTE